MNSPDTSPTDASAAYPAGDSAGDSTTLAGDPLFRAIDYLRSAPEPGWDAIAGRVVATIRATARSGGQAVLAQSPPSRTGSGRIFVSDHVLRSTLAVVLRERFLCAPTRIDFDIDTRTQTLRTVLIELTGSYGTPLRELAGVVRSTTREVVAEILGDAPTDGPGGGPIDIAITDVVTGDPLSA